MATSPEPPRRGRPRRSETDAAILEAAAGMLAREGYAGLSIEGVALKAGVGKTTIYRRWRSKSDIVEDLLDSINEVLPLDESGDIRADLIAFYLVLLSGRSAAGPRIAILSAMIAEAVHNREIARLLRERYMRPRRAVMVRIVRDARERGALRPDADPDAIVDMIAGLVWYRRLVLGIAPRREDAEAIVDLALRGAGLYTKR
jgi:AcrR family transcriptional regulator